MEIELRKKTYEELQQELIECILKSRAYEKALDKACELIAEAVNQDCTIFDEIIESPYLYRTEVREWKEWLLND